MIKRIREEIQILQLAEEDAKIFKKTRQEASDTFKNE